jgi:hypothetical protein
MGSHIEEGSVSDPDPEGQKLTTKIEKIRKFHVLMCWKFSFEDLRLLLNF